MLNVKCSMTEILTETGRWLLLPIWLPAFLLTIAAGYILVWSIPRSLVDWAFDIRR